MATPIAVAVLPLGEGQTIQSWQPFFIAAVSALIGTEGGEKASLFVIIGEVQVNIGFWVTVQNYDSKLI